MDSQFTDGQFKNGQSTEGQFTGSNVCTTIVFALNLLGCNFFEPHFLPKIFVDPKLFFIQNFFDPKFVLDPKFF